MSSLSCKNCKFSRVWAMPSPDTFSIKPIGDFVHRHLRESVVVDPFARNTTNIATHTNDINPDTKATYHMDAVAFLKLMKKKGVVADTVIFDPPYSPRQVAEVYNSFGKKTQSSDTQTGKLYRRCKKQILRISKKGTICLSFGWNSAGQGTYDDSEDGGFFEKTKLSWRTLEIMLVAHGGAHNDTICVAQELV